MYKKIKNGSFMNWIWFIVALLPLCFILFSLNNDENKTQVYQNELSYINSSENLYLDDWDNAYGDMTYDYLNNNILIQKGDENDEFTFQYFLTIKENVQENYWYYFLFKLPYEISVYTLDIYINLNGFYSNILSISYDNEYIDYIILPFQYNYELNEENYYSLKITINLEYNEFANDRNLQFGIFANENYIEKELFKGFPNEIVYQPFLNNLQTNGFISNAFLNLAQFFGVTNVYYSLACYYIEYLLIIILLHLAFDVLYMLPNICHKFMEKIGGERD